MGARVSGFISTSLVLFLLLFVGRVDAAVTWRVTNNGTDSGICGPAATPCRSISQAIENASDGDTIEVGAGVYGDISGTGTFTGPGDEHPDPGRGGGPDPSMIRISKALRILSLHGAEATFIRGAPGAGLRSTVVINHDAVTFGTKDHGFTVGGGAQIGVLISVWTDDGASFPLKIAAGIRVAGNVDVGDEFGFRYDGAQQSGHPCDGGCVFTGLVSWSDNVAVDNSSVGFFYDTGQVDFEPSVFQNNRSIGGATGFQVRAGGSFPGAQNVSVINNVATGGTGFGFDLNSPGEVRGNTAAGNGQGGFLIVPGNRAFSNNSAVGNGGPGVIVNFSLDSALPQLLNPDEPIPTFHAFNHNNIYGNDRNRPVLQLRPQGDFGGIAFNPGPSAHCGVLDVGQLAGPVQPGNDPPIPGMPVKLPVADNYWGSNRGPSPTGPGDAVGGACDQNNSTTNPKPFATSLF